MLSSVVCTVPHHQCSRTYLGRLGNGVISSYNYPFDYRDNLTCVYRIYLDSKPNVSQTVCLTFRRFSLENSSPFCSFDYVELGLSPPVKYCGAGLWQYGVEEKGNLFSNIWSPNLCCKYDVSWCGLNSFAVTSDLLFPLLLASLHLDVYALVRADNGEVFSVCESCRWLCG